jgi:hypothetical protein
MFSGARPRTPEEIADALARLAEEATRQRRPGSRTSRPGHVLGSHWGNPERYRIQTRLDLAETSSSNETVKELCRRPPWSGPKDR